MSSLNPKITSSYNNLLSQIETVEVTGLYDLVNNPFGWGVPILAKADVVSAKLIVLKNKEPYGNFDVLAVIAASGAVEQFDLQDIEVEADGAYILKYSIDDDISMADHVSVFVSEQLKVIASKMWAQLAICHDVYIRKDLERECHWLEMTLLGLDAVARRGQEDSWLNLYKAASLRYENNKGTFNFKF